LLARTPGLEDKYLQAGLTDSDENIRITALRIARDLKKDIPSIVKQLVNDPSAQVRREAAIALRDIKTPEAATLWGDLAAKHTAGDRWETEALGIGAAGNDDACLAAYLKKAG